MRCGFPAGTPTASCSAARCWGMPLVAGSLIVSGITGFIGKSRKDGGRYWILLEVGCAEGTMTRQNVDNVPEL